MILSNFLPLLVPYFDSELMSIWYFPLLALAFLATVPCIVKMFWR